jgi:TrmH family RNA methyltransferase
VVIVSEDALHRTDTAALVSRLDAVAITVPVPLFARFASLPVGVGVVAVVTTPREQQGGRADFCLLLEDLQDPGNVGSILRSAAGAGVDRVVLSRTCAFAWSPKVLRAGQGGHFLVAIEEDVDLVAWCGRFHAEGGRTIATVARGGASLYATNLAGRVAFAIGNEGAGLSPELQERVQHRVHIPMPGGMESLNAAAAAAICLFERVRQTTRVAQ